MKLISSLSLCFRLVLLLIFNTSVNAQNTTNNPIYPVHNIYDASIYARNTTNNPQVYTSANSGNTKNTVLCFTHNGETVMEYDANTMAEVIEYQGYGLSVRTEDGKQLYSTEGLDRATLKQLKSFMRVRRDLSGKIPDKYVSYKFLSKIRIQKFNDNVLEDMVTQLRESSERQRRERMNNERMYELERRQSDSEMRMRDMINFQEKR